MMPARLGPDVCEKGGEIIYPFGSDLDASLAITSITAICGIVASLFHLRPCAVFAGSPMRSVAAAVGCVAMGRLLFGHVLFLQAPTR